MRHSATLQPFRLLNPDATRPLLLICDHASAEVPPELNGLGLPEGEIRRHIGWDIGAADLTDELSRRLDATAVLAGVSRLVIDCNRAPGHPTSICPSSDGTPIPANQALTPAQAEARAQAWYHPYQRAIAHQLERLEANGGQQATLIAIHSFTPCLKDGGCQRPWPVGILWNQDGRLAEPLIAALRSRGLTCGDNEPYSGRVANHTVDRHGQDAGRPHVSIEIRQDEISTANGVARWAGILAEVLGEIENNYIFGDFLF